MHQTTVRFGPDLWDALEQECARLGVSVAQYLREAALTRLVYAAGKRGDDEFELALDLVDAQRSGSALGRLGELDEAVAPARGADTARERALREGADASALAAQGALARQRSRELRERAARRRRG